MDYHNLQQGPKKKLLLTKKGLDKLRQKLDALTAKRRDTIKTLQQTDKDEVDELHLASTIQQLESTETETVALTTLL